MDKDFYLKKEINISEIPELRNDYPIDIYLAGRIYPSVEHAFQASKTSNSKIREEICKASTAREAKTLGRNLNLRPDWDIIKTDVMEFLVRQKFFSSKGDVCRKALLDTDVSDLYMYSSKDLFWGWDPSLLEGDNNLGDILSSIRNELFFTEGIGPFYESDTEVYDLTDSILDFVDSCKTATESEVINKFYTCKDRDVCYALKHLYIMEELDFNETTNVFSIP